MTVRLQKFLADCGIASRRKSEELIKAGMIRINGVTADIPGTPVDTAADVVTYNGQLVKPVKNKIYILFNKPEGCITSVNDQFGRPTVMDYIKTKERIVPVGRLDYDTSGLLLLTNDGALTFKLTHPKYKIEKTYAALVEGIPSEQSLSRLRSGLVIDGYKTSPARVKMHSVSNTTCRLEIIVHEGRNRQVRKMCEAVGHKVIKLKRIRLGALTLDGVREGEYRLLTEKEIEDLV